MMAVRSLARRSLSYGAYCQLPKEVESQLCTPALAIYGDVVRRNISRVIEACGSPDRWQPHIKTVKSSWAINALADAGVTRFKCATSREAELLGATLGARVPRGADFQVLVAYPHLGPTLDRVAAAAFARPNIRWAVLVEDAAGAERVVAANERGGATLDVYLDVNPGMDRTGVALGDAATAAAAAVQGVARERLAGLHMYDGHAETAGATAEERAAALAPLYDRLLELDAALGGVGDDRRLITAGTPALLASIAHAGLEATGRHAVSAGTVVFADARATASCPVGLAPAALVLSRVISEVSPTLVTLDAGVKSLAADCGHPMAHVVDRPDLACEIPSEEHLPVRASGDAVPVKGDFLYLVPKHVCPTVNLAETALLVDGPPEDRSYSELAIEARAHPLLASGAAVEAVPPRPLAL